MAKNNAAPILLGGLGIFLLMRRGDDSAPATGPVNCDELAGIWNPNGPPFLSMLAYDGSYERIQTLLLDDPEEGGQNKEAIVMSIVKDIAPACDWDNVDGYSDRMLDVYNSIGIVFDKVMSDMAQGVSGG